MFFFVKGYGVKSGSVTPVTPGQLDPESYPSELQGGFQPERRRNRTYSEGTNKTPGGHKEHKSHGGRSPGAQQYNKSQPGMNIKRYLVIM